MADRLLRHPVPYINESIGNYVLRLCSENSCALNDIADLIGFKLRGIDKFYGNLKEKHIVKLSESTGIDIKVIEDMTANRFCFNDRYNDFRCSTEAFLCPKCYSESSYERIHWKNKLIKLCLDHQIYLVDECPGCKDKITSKMIFNGKCNCGLLLNDFSYTKCVNESVLHNQNIMYQIFNIKNSVSFKKYDLLYNSLSGEDYCLFYHHLVKIATQYAEDLNILNIFTKNDDYHRSTVIAAWLMLNWPINLINFLNVLNSLDIKYINRISSFEVGLESLSMYMYREKISEKFMRIFNPIECLKLNNIHEIILGYKEIYEPIMKYHYENINREKIKNKMYRYIYLNRYVEIDIAINIFFILDSDKLYKSYSEINKFAITYFHVYKFFNKKYFDLEEIFDFYDKIKENCSTTYNDIKDIMFQYESFLHIFQHFHITLSDVIQVQINSKLKLRFNPIGYHGLLSIRFHHKQTKKALLLLLANQIDVNI